MGGTNPNPNPDPHADYYPDPNTDVIPQLPGLKIRVIDADSDSKDSK